MTFVYGGDEPPTSVQVTAYPFGEYEDSGNGDTSEPGQVVLSSRRSGNEAYAPAELPAGEHVIQVAVTAREDDVVLNGEASYGFRIVVE